MDVTTSRNEPNLGVAGRGTLRCVNRPERYLIDVGAPTPTEVRPPAATPGDRRRRWIFGVALAIAAVVAAVVIPLVSPDRVSDGRQLADAEPVEVGSPADDAWQSMEPLAADERNGFPAPVVSIDDSICIGFARIDFGPDDVRPSLARCVPHASDTVDADAVRLLVSVKSGFDTWHFVEAGNDVVAVEVATADGTIDPGRIYLAGAIIGLRMQNGVDVERFTWSTIAGAFECDADLSAWENGAFCNDL